MNLNQNYQQDMNGNAGAADNAPVNQEALDFIRILEDHLHNNIVHRSNVLVDQFQEAHQLVRELDEEQEALRAQPPRHAPQPPQPPPRRRTHKFVGIGPRLVKIKVSIRKYSRKKTVVKFTFYYKRCRIFKRIRCECQERRRQQRLAAAAAAAAAVAAAPVALPGQNNDHRAAERNARDAEDDGEDLEFLDDDTVSSVSPNDVAVRLLDAELE